MQIKDIILALENFAPRSLQESYDNSGIQCGDSSQICTQALVCLDCTEAVVEEAIDNGCNLIIAHHPLIFGKGLLSITGKSWEERVLLKALKNDIVIYAIHTNLDNILHGVNQKIAEKLGLIDVRILAPKKELLCKLVTFVPSSHAEQVREAICRAGAGRIGEYSDCTFQAAGTGTFKALEKATPYVGSIGEIHRESEIRLETIFPNYLEEKVVSALISSHPYEEVAYDLSVLKNKWAAVGSGVIGRFLEPVEETDFLKWTKKAMECDAIRHTQLIGRKISKVAVCGGSGAFLLSNAMTQEADAFVTADFKYHQFFDADKRILVVDIGHYESEHFTIEQIKDVLNNNFPTFAVRLSKINTNPINYL